MKTLYFDIIGGMSGDMAVAALVDLGVSRKRLEAGLSKLDIKGFDLAWRRLQRGHIEALKFDVLVKETRNFSYPQIRKLLIKSSLSPEVRKNCLAVYEILKRSEQSVHGRSYDGHFHQLGELDSIVDIVAFCLCLQELGAPRVFYSVIPLSLKVSPAVSKMLEGDLVYFTPWSHENITPTGMAILRAFGKQLEKDRENFVYGKCGFGAGTKDPLEVSNVLRVTGLGESGLKGLPESEEVLVIEANIDDMNPQIFGYVFERLFAEGAIDVFVQNVMMKKSRPGFLLTVLSKPDNLGKISDIVFRETSTIGLRYHSAGRIKLTRSVSRTSIPGLGHVRLKTVILPDGTKRSMPEYEDCVVLSKKNKLPLIEVMAMAKALVVTRNQ